MLRLLSAVMAKLHTRHTCACEQAYATGHGPCWCGQEVYCPDAWSGR